MINVILSSKAIYLMIKVLPVKNVIIDYSTL